MSIMTPSKFETAPRTKIQTNKVKEDWDADTNINQPNNYKKQKGSYGSYYILVAEWCYPSGCGHSQAGEIFDNEDEAYNTAQQRCKGKMAELERECGCESTKPTIEVGASIHGSYMGYIIEPKDTHKWFYIVKVIEVSPKYN